MLCPMLPYERRVVAALLTTPDAGQRQRVTEFVGGSLGAMPEILRFGIASISIALGAFAAVRDAVGRRPEPEAEVIWLDTNPIGLIRQWVRALRSLVLFAEQEQLGQGAPEATAP